VQKVSISFYAEKFPVDTEELNRLLNQIGELHQQILSYTDAARLYCEQKVPLSKKDEEGLRSAVETQRELLSVLSNLLEQAIIQPQELFFTTLSRLALGKAIADKRNRLDPLIAEEILLAQRGGIKSLQVWIHVYMTFDYEEIEGIHVISLTSRDDNTKMYFARVTLEAIESLRHNIRVISVKSKSS
jgi:hypothetical protein